MTYPLLFQWNADLAIVGENVLLEKSLFKGLILIKSLIWEFQDTGMLLQENINIKSFKN